MGLNLKLINRTTKVSTSDIIHSTGYASVRSGANFGASDNTTFSERQQIEQQRKLIKGYRNARVAQGSGILPRARSYEEEIALQAAMTQIDNSARSSIDRQKAAIEQDRGGLRKYDFRSRQTDFHNKTARGGSAMTSREAMAKRFDAPARPTPKTGGFGR